MGNGFLTRLYRTASHRVSVSRALYGSVLERGCLGLRAVCWLVVLEYVTISVYVVGGFCASCCEEDVLVSCQRRTQASFPPFPRAIFSVLTLPGNADLRYPWSLSRPCRASIGRGSDDGSDDKLGDLGDLDSSTRSVSDYYPCWGSKFRAEDFFFGFVSWMQCLEGTQVRPD